MTGHPSGVQNHVLRVQLQDYTSAILDIPFTVDLISCDVTGFYADSIENIAISPSRQTGILATDYVLLDIVTFVATFDDLITSQGTSCASVYEKTYSLRCTSCIDPSV